MSSARSAKAVMQRHARSFWLAAGFLPEQQVQSLARLYAFCRYADDLADAMPAGINADTLNELRAGLSAGEAVCEASADLIDQQTDRGGHTVAKTDELIDRSEAARVLIYDEGVDEI